MNGKASKETGEEFVGFIRQWDALESRTISGAQKLMEKSSNPFVKTVMGMMIHDSEKHRLVQKMIVESLTKEALHISPDELNEVSELLNDHIKAEDEYLCRAQDACCKSELVSTRFFLNYLIADEAKHHALVDQLDALRTASIPTSASARC